ncbi:MAG TPA: alpha/beta hydrolase [Gemmataceae bacterium]|jgi:pimeloyl-ACP methyl ester carboxylesterase|nr:alpha/beta hydrolase [Gemmataceae bacterium]
MKSFCIGFLVFAAVAMAFTQAAAAEKKPASGTFDSKGVKICYAVQGKGEPVVLVHGWLSSAAINWDLPGITAALAKDYQVIELDVRGHGQSDKPTKEEEYGPELVEDIVRLLDHLEVKKAHIVGYSMGGVITANFIVKHPDRVLSGTLGGMGWLREGSLEQKVFAAGGRDGKPVGLCFKSLAKLALTEEQIKSIKVPVAVIFGDKDGLKKLYADPLKSVRADWPVIEIKDADHISCIMKPEFREGIQKWLAKQAKE